MVAIDPRGNGLSDQPTVEAADTDDEFVADVVAVMDEAAARPCHLAIVDDQETYFEGLVEFLHAL